MKTDRDEVKRKLRKWGRVKQICAERQVRIGQYQNLLEGLGRNEDQMDGVDLERIAKSHQESIQNLTEGIEALNRFSDRMEKLVAGLDAEEEMVMRLYYGRGATIYAISMKMHMSRATVFRIKERALDKLAGFMREEGEEEYEN